MALGKQRVPGEADWRVVFVFGGVALSRISRNFHNIQAEIIDELGI